MEWWSALGSLGLGAVGGFISHYIGDWWKAEKTSERLSKALIIESIATLNKLREVVVDELGADLDRVRHKKSLSQTEARQLPSGYIWTPPIDAMRELVQLLDDFEKARLVIHFYDRWTRLIEFEKRYALLYPKLLDSSLDGALREEYSGQVIASLKEVYLAGCELCSLSCDIFRKFRTGDEYDLPKQCDNMWLDYKALNSDAKKYTDVIVRHHKLCSDPLQDASPATAS